jgi:FAD synthase
MTFSWLILKKTKKIFVLKQNVKKARLVSIYTGSDSRLGIWQEGALNLSQALASSEAVQLE